MSTTKKTICPFRYKVEQWTDSKERCDPLAHTTLNPDKQREHQVALIAVEPPFSVDDLAQEIRRVDGNHNLGAAQLAEALMPFIIKNLSLNS